MYIYDPGITGFFWISGFQQEKRYPKQFPEILESFVILLTEVEFGLFMAIQKFPMFVKQPNFDISHC
jgi:hypothetical protein